MYNLLVNKNADIGKAYRQYRHEKHNARRSNAWLYLLKLNIQYRVHLQSGHTPKPSFHKTKIILEAGSESFLAKRESSIAFAKKLAAYDVISFDVFDTLIFRPFSKPTDLFFLIGSKLNYLDFERIRIEMEELARTKAQKSKQTREVFFEEIWTTIEEEVGINCNVGMDTELATELQFCFANPYMLQVVQELQLQEKKIVLISDMYLGKERIQKLLTYCGYEGLEDCFVSCDYEQSKNEGTLYDIVRKTFPLTHTCVHVGDNDYADRIQANQHGFKGIYYRNVNDAGMKYRAMNMSVMMGSIYRGLVNTYLHNGLYAYSKEYEFGFTYGGLFVLGYCQWIHEYVKGCEIDKILFLARDGEVLSKVYDYLYPQESQNWEYVYWSRRVATKLSANQFKYDYFRRFLYQKINQAYTLNAIFETMDLHDMLDSFLASPLNEKKYTANSVLNKCAADEIKRYLQRNWKNVLEHYKEELDAGGMYYSNILKGCKNVVAIDVGWAGSGAVTLNYIVNHLWGINCNITGLIAGTNSPYCNEQDASESLLYTGRLKSYLFSQTHNRTIWEQHNPGRGDNLVVETLLSAKHGSLKRFLNNDVQYEFTDNGANKHVEEIQQGILDFVKYYLVHMKQIPKISGSDAFAPIAYLTQSGQAIKQFPFINQVKMNIE